MKKNLKVKDTTRWIKPIWEKKIYKIGIINEESFVGQINELFLALAPNLQNVFRKYKARLKGEIDEADFQQIIFVVTMKLLISWEPSKSAFGTYLRNYLWKRCLDIMKKRPEHPFDCGWDIQNNKPYCGEGDDDQW